jgi:chromosome transmission fidelity protein 18
MSSALAKARRSGFTVWIRKSSHSPQPSKIRAKISPHKIARTSNTPARPLDELTTYLTSSTNGTTPNVPTRYAVRQVLDQEYQKNIIVRENAARQARFRAGNLNDEDETYNFAAEQDKTKERYKKFDPDEVPLESVKKDFFGRVLVERSGNVGGGAAAGAGGGEGKRKKGEGKGKSDNKVWVSFHEGFSNAVRKPITVEELLSGL